MQHTHRHRLRKIRGRINCMLSMTISAARTGREKQRYQGHLRLVAGCIPYKRVEGRRVVVLMISTPKRKDLVFPKGGWEDDESLAEAASREAFEEAGVLGLIGENPLGEWEFRSKSSEKSSSSSSLRVIGGCCKGYMFALQVTHELDLWPGHSIYSRIWVGIEEAFQVCRYEWMRDALQKFLISVGVGVAEVDHHHHPILLSSHYLENSNTITPPPPPPPPPNLLEL